MRKLVTIFFCIALSPVYAQNGVMTLSPDGGGSYSSAPSDEMSPEQRLSIRLMLQHNVQQLQEAGILSGENKPMTIAFQWPLRRAAGFTDNGFYGISNYVDHNHAVPNQVIDYNCGNRSYDLSSGYNHAGTDIFIWPFAWTKMANNQVEVVAAAPGLIIGKSDGNYDQNCAFCTTACDWNAIYIQHSDGSVAWYGHLKSGSLTTKGVGQLVAPGEFLGRVGSSGNSTGPHLHFEVYTNNTYTQLIDPWDGSCNSLNPGVSWWASQETYRVPTLNAVMTHSAPPAPGNCAGSEQINLKTVFLPGDPIYFGSYYRDQMVGQSATHTIYRPDNSVWVTWNQSLTSTFNASWWYYSRTLPASGSNLLGNWRYEVNFGTQTVSTVFTVSNGTLPDLLVTGSSLNPTTINAGDVLTASFTITNNGSNVAGAHKTSFYLSQDNVLTPGVNGDILLGEHDLTIPLNPADNSGPLTKQLTVPCHLSSGTYHLFMVADGTGIIAESDESNNSISVPVNVTGSNAFQVQILQPDTAVCIGFPITLTATGADSYVWSPSTGLNTTTGSSVTSILITLTPVTYTVTGTKNGCSTTDQVTITPKPLVFPYAKILFSGCPDNNLVFTASVFAGGTNPQLEWFVNNVSSGTGPTLTLNNAVNGTKVRVVLTVLTVTGICASPSIISSPDTTINCITTAIQELEDAGSIKMGPNPTNGYLNIELKLTRARQVDLLLFDASGRLLQENHKGRLSGTNHIALDLKRYTAGTYILKIRIGNKELMQKIIRNP